MDAKTLYPEFPIFKGLQRPLEFMGLQGRYIYWAAGTIGGALISFIIGFISFGFYVGLGILTICLGTGGVLVFVKQRKGLHSKPVGKGVYIFFHSRNYL